jgi:hypothetical protein
MYRNIGVCVGGYCFNVHCSITLSFLLLFTFGGGVRWGGWTWRGDRGGLLRWVGGLRYSIQNVTTLGPVVFIALEIACCILYVVPF